MTIREYDDGERTNLVARVVAGETMRGVSEDSGVPYSTLKGWVDSYAEQDRSFSLKIGSPAAYDHAALYGRATALGAQLIQRELQRRLDQPDNPVSARDLQSLAIVSGISADKHLDYRDGRKGTQITVDNRSLQLPPGLSLDELRALALTPVERIEGPSEPSPSP